MLVRKDRGSNAQFIKHSRHGEEQQIGHTGFLAKSSDVKIAELVWHHVGHALDSQTPINSVSQNCGFRNGVNQSQAKQLRRADLVHNCGIRRHHFAGYVAMRHVIHKLRHRLIVQNRAAFILRRSTGTIEIIEGSVGVPFSVTGTSYR